MHPVTHRIYTFDVSATCDTNNVVYLATCTACSSFYIGKTNRKLKERIIEHKSEIRRACENNALFKHIDEYGCSHKFNFRVIDVIFSSIRGGDMGNLLEVKEFEWIVRLSADSIPGLNSAVSLKPILVHIQHTKIK